MSKGATPVAVIPPLLVAGHLCQLPHTPVPAAEVIDYDAEKKAVPVILPAPVTTRSRETCTSCRRTRSKPSTVSRCRPVFGGKGRVKPRLCNGLACPSKRSTKRRRRADNLKGTLPFEQHIKTKIKREKNIGNIRTYYNSVQLYTSAGTPGPYRVCSVHVSPV